MQGDLHRARASFRRAATLALQLGATTERAASLLNQGILTLIEGAPGKAQLRVHHALGLYGQTRDSRGIAHAQNCLGVIAYGRHDHLAAWDGFLAAVARFRALNDLGAVAVNASNLGWIAEADGELDEARQWYEEAQQIWEDVEDVHGRAWAMADLARLARSQGDFGRAWVLTANALRAFDDLGDRPLAESCVRQLEAIHVGRNGRRPVRHRSMAGAVVSETDGIQCMSARSGARGPAPGPGSVLALSRSGLTGLLLRANLTEAALEQR
jgi:tetratricopeptide (TPR) repeat protein